MMRSACPALDAAPRVLIVDDDEASMRAVAKVLDVDERIEVVGQTSHAQAAIPMAEVLVPDVVLMDIHMQGLDPIQACETIVQGTHPCSRVLLYSAFAHNTDLERCLAVGASGIVSKHTESLKHLAYAIRHVASGKRYFSPEVDPLGQREQKEPAPAGWN